MRYQSNGGTTICNAPSSRKRRKRRPSVFTLNSKVLHPPLACAMLQWVLLACARKNSDSVCDGNECRKAAFSLFLMGPRVCVLQSLTAGGHL